MRAICEIAREIRADWKNIYFGAKPYVSAMSTISNINDIYIIGDGRSIVQGFLANAGTWRGETARRVKKELNEMLKK